MNVFRFPLLLACLLSWYLWHMSVLCPTPPLPAGLPLPFAKCHCWGERIATRQKRFVGGSRVWLIYAVLSDVCLINGLLSEYVISILYTWINLKKRAGAPISLTLFSRELTGTQWGYFFRILLQQSKNKNISLVEHGVVSMALYRLSPEYTKWWRKTCRRFMRRQGFFWNYLQYVQQFLATFL